MTRSQFIRSAPRLSANLCDKNAVTHNPVKGVKRPRSESGEGKTPALGDHQARDLLAAPAEDRLKDKRDRAIPSTLLYHALRRRNCASSRSGISDIRGVAWRISKC